MLVPQFHTGQVNPEVPNGDRLVVERVLRGVHYHPLSHVHLLAFDQVVYGARGFFRLKHICLWHKTTERQQKWNIIYIYICWCDM